MGETGQTCGYVETGAMYIASTADRDWVAAEVARLQAKGIAIRLWNAVEARRHVPDFQWQDGDIVVHEPHAGYVDPLQTVTALLQHAQAAGVTVSTGRRVTALRTGPDGIAGVEVDGEVITARAVVVAAGAWSRELLQPLGLGSTLYAKAIQVNRLDLGQAKAWPCWLDLQTLGYGRPGANGEVWFGAGLDERSLGLGEQPCRPEDTARAHALASVRLPELLNAPVIGGSRIADAYTHDRRGLLGEVTDVPGLVLATGWGGTGFMLAMAVGDHVAAGIKRQSPIDRSRTTTTIADL
jgi:glycine/D-amino acid oxidase-like deaminating enzyme